MATLRPLGQRIDAGRAAVNRAVTELKHLRAKADDLCDKWHETNRGALDTETTLEQAYEQLETLLVSQARPTDRQPTDLANRLMAQLATLTATVSAAWPAEAGQPPDQLYSTVQASRTMLAVAAEETGMLEAGSDSESEEEEPMEQDSGEVVFVQPTPQQQEEAADRQQQRQGGEDAQTGQGGHS